METWRHHPVYTRFACIATLYMKAMVAYKFDFVLNEYRIRAHELVMVARGIDGDLGECLRDAYDELDMMRFRTREVYRRR